MITEEELKTLDTRALIWYRKHIAHLQECSANFNRAYQGDPKAIFNQHFKELIAMLNDEIKRRENR